MRFASICLFVALGALFIRLAEAFSYGYVVRGSADFKTAIGKLLRESDFLLPRSKWEVGSDDLYIFSDTTIAPVDVSEFYWRTIVRSPRTYFVTRRGYYILEFENGESPETNSLRFVGAPIREPLPYNSLFVEVDVGKEKTVKTAQEAI